MPNKEMIVRIGTRGSKLALAQCTWVKDRVETKYPDVTVELVRIKTRGDKILDSPLSEIGGKGLFVKEIEEALLRKDVDLAVHSMKDVPTEFPDDLQISVFPEREDPRDGFVSITHRTLGDLPKGATVGTSSLRRSAQLLSLRPDLNIVSIRGNVDTRLSKLESGDFQAIILAVAGLKRLGFIDKISQVLTSDELLPAVGQGALGLETRKNDDKISELFRFMNHRPTELVVRAERAFLETLEGGCQVPIAAYGRIDRDNLILRGMVADLDGSRIIRDEMRGNQDGPEAIGITLARRLLSSGADQILSRFYGSGS